MKSTLASKCFGTSFRYCSERAFAFESMIAKPSCDFLAVMGINEYYRMEQEVAIYMSRCHARY